MVFSAGGPDFEVMSLVGVLVLVLEHTVVGKLPDCWDVTPTSSVE